PAECCRRVSCWLRAFEKSRSYWESIALTGAEDVPGALWSGIRSKARGAEHIVGRACVCRAVSRRALADTPAAWRRTGSDRSRADGGESARFRLLPVLPQSVNGDRMGNHRRRRVFSAQALWPRSIDHRRPRREPLVP